MWPGQETEVGHENLDGDIAARGSWVSAWGLEQQGPLDFNRRAVGNH